MKNKPDDKAERVLTIYSKLKQGKIVYRSAMSKVYGVSERTIQRDITDVQCFLQNQFMETGNIQEVIFDKKMGGYRLQIKRLNELNGKSVLAVCKILLESRALIKSEMLPIIYSLTELCGDDMETETVKHLISNEIQYYTELQHGRKLLDQLWSLEHAVKAHKYIEIRYKGLQSDEEIIRKVKPVGIMFSEFYFYLASYGTVMDEGVKDMEENEYLHIYRVDRIRKCTVLEEYFRMPYVEWFDDEEFRKRISLCREQT